MKRLRIPSSPFAFSIFLAYMLLCGCVPSHHSPIEVRMVERLKQIDSRLGTSREDLWKEISNSGSYSREQALDLKRRVGELVVAYEQLAVEANCAEHHYPTCQDFFTAGLRYNTSILDAEHPDLPSLPPVVKGYRLHGSPVD